MKQSTNHVLMVRPAHFGYNTETADSNAFQHESAFSQSEIQQKALDEFDAYVAKLRAHKIKVTVIEDTDLPVKPDAIFPNNWISFHENGTIVLYPMNTRNRQAERREDIVEKMAQEYGFSKVIHLEENEQKSRFLEGTGSIVFDHEAGIAFACISPRTNKELLFELCEQIGYCPFVFTAVDENIRKIYHTNVLMNIAKGFAVVCLESITDLREREELIALLEKNKHNVVAISLAQMKQFAGNMLCVENEDGKSWLVCSESAYNSLTEAQRIIIGHYAAFLPIAIPTIENIGGGSARCMMAEVFEPLKNHS